jgi:hypothetical protein
MSDFEKREAELQEGCAEVGREIERRLTGKGIPFIRGNKIAFWSEAPGLLRSVKPSIVIDVDWRLEHRIVQIKVRSGLNSQPNLTGVYRERGHGRGYNFEGIVAKFEECVVTAIRVSELARGQRKWQEEQDRKRKELDKIASRELAEANAMGLPDVRLGRQEDGTYVVSINCTYKFTLEQTVKLIKILREGVSDA